MRVWIKWRNVGSCTKVVKSLVTWLSSFPPFAGGKTDGFKKFCVHGQHLDDKVDECYQIKVHATVLGG